MAGRIPAPAQLKLLNGRSPGRDSGGRVVEAPPEFKREPPVAPIWLSPEARAEWNRVVPDLARLDLLKRIDMSSLVAYCECWARFVQASLIVAKEGMVLQADKVGRAQRHPALLTAEAASKAEARLRTGRKDDDGRAANPFASSA